MTGGTRPQSSRVRRSRCCRSAIGPDRRDKCASSLPASPPLLLTGAAVAAPGDDWKEIASAFKQDFKKKSVKYKQMALDGLPLTDERTIEFIIKEAQAPVPQGLVGPRGGERPAEQDQDGAAAQAHVQLREGPGLARPRVHPRRAGDGPGQGRRPGDRRGAQGQGLARAPDGLLGRRPAARPRGRRADDRHDQRRRSPDGQARPGGRAPPAASTRSSSSTSRRSPASTSTRTPSSGARTGSATRTARSRP